MDPEQDQEYLYIALEGLQAPVPEPWEACKNEEGDVFFRNSETEEFSWNHPMDDFYRDLFQEIKSRDINQRKKAEKDKKMRKTAGKLQGLAPLKSQKSNENNGKNFKKEEEEVNLPSKINNKLMNISDISSNNSKKSHSFLAEESQNNKESFDLNSSLLKSSNRTPKLLHNKSGRNSPLHNRKLKLPSDCSNKDIDKWYQNQIKKLINDKEEEFKGKNEELIEKEREIEKELEEKLMRDMEILIEKKENTVRDIGEKDKKEPLLKDRLKKEYQEKLMKKIDELKKGIESKKNSYKENLMASNKNNLDKFTNEMIEMYKSKEINEKNIKIAKKPKPNEDLSSKKEQILKELEGIYEINLENYKIEEIRKLKMRKEKQMEKNSKELQQIKQEINDISTPLKSEKIGIQEIYQRKLTLAKKTVNDEFEENLLEFQRIQQQNLNEKINKYKQNLLETEHLALNQQLLEEKEGIKRMYQRKLDLIKLQNPKETQDEEEKTMKDKENFQILQKDINEIMRLLVKYEVLNFF